MGSDMIIAAQNSGGSGAFNLLLLLAVPLVFYFLLIRPQSKRRKEQLAMQSAIEPGTKVITTAGMHATVVEVDEDGELLLEIAPGVQARFLKQAVMTVVKDEPADEADDEELDGGTDTVDTPGAAKPAASIDLSKDDAVGHADAEEAGTAAPAGKAAEKPSA
ncbi:preprotein translocase subunit YajC [Actinomadura hibisca]|uniref:preprotein translocase subunit YajC n=1 Tax=Actinomadura hibisca TaxID=68565 RepID=UPI000830AB14|nr:preprotein translocase subunit YajC [Actinomadura hibisca]